MKLPMTKWILDKVLMSLTNHEGCVLETEGPQTAIIQDAFGFRYEIALKAISRVDNQEVTDAAISYPISLAITKVID